MAKSAEYEVGLIIQGGNTEIAEVADGCTGHTQQGVRTHLAKAEGREAKASQAHLVFTGAEVHHVLLGGRLFARVGNQPELVGTSATIEVVSTGSFEDCEDIIASAAQGTVCGAADDEVVVAAHTAEAVAIAAGGSDHVIAAAAGDHIAATGRDHVGTGTGEDRVAETAVQFTVHQVVASAGEDGVRLEGELLSRIGQLDQIIAAGESERGADN